jgi:hypothetical protein
MSPVLTQYRIYLGLASRQIYSGNRCTRSDQYPCHLGIAADFVTGWELHEPRGRCEIGVRMKETVPVESAPAVLDARIKELKDWRGKTLARVREIIHEADPEIVEEWKWVKPTTPGVPVFSHGSIVCTAETYKDKVKMTFAKGAALKDPSGLFNSSLEGNVRRAIDVHEGDKVNESALKDLIRAAVALNLKGKNKPKLRRAPRKRAV